MVDLDSAEAKLFETLLAWKRSHPQGGSTGGAVADPAFDYGTVDHVRQPQMHLDKAKREHVADLYQRGVSVKVIAQQFGVYRKTVREIAKAAGLEPKPRGLLPDQIVRAAALYESGWSAGPRGRGVRGRRVVCQEGDRG